MDCHILGEDSDAEQEKPWTLPHLMRSAKIPLMWTETTKFEFRAGKAVGSDVQSNVPTFC